MASKGEKISKSKGNSKVEPRELVKTHSADSIRYWAGTGRLGNDIIFSEETLARGQKLINKLWNVAKFIEMHIHDYNENNEKFKEEVREYNDLEYIDKWILAKYEEMEKGYLKYLEEYEIGIALNHLEKFFWNFCDDYIEIVKHRLYRPEEFGERARYSGQKTVYTLLFKLIQAFSIYLPYVTEEIYHELYMNDMNIPSIHITSIENLNIEDKNKETYLNIGNTIMEIISELRGEKTNNNVSLKTPFSIVEIDVNSNILDGITKAEKDFKATVTIENLKLNDKQTSLENNFNILKSELIIEEK
jgi:valine--tRNA ligase